jgi:uncharacterized protein YggU (UPF0235/DUF167 family)
MRRVHSLTPGAGAAMRVIGVKVKPGARRNAVTEQTDGTWLVEVTAPPVDGEANDAVVRAVALHLGLRRAQVRIKSGAGSRLKRLEIDD